MKCADTTVALGRRILGKTQDAADAARTLALLSGHSHHVLTAMAIHDGRRHAPRAEYLAGEAGHKGPEWALCLPNALARYTRLGSSHRCRRTASA